MSDIADFDKLLHDVEALLRRDQRVAYRILKRRFCLDEEDLEDIKADLIDAKRSAVDESGKVLVYHDGRSAGNKAERRQLTVMFCDIVGSTELSDRLDPEDLRELLRRYQQRCGRIIDDAHGHIAQYLGDGLLVYFGYPIAYEDAAVRAVSCGLEIINAVAGITTVDGQPLQVRLGVHTGTVVIGDVGGGENREQLALGDTPNVAARIQGEARPNELMISEATLRLLQDSFDYKNRGETSLRGVAVPVTLYTVQRARDVRSRNEALRRSGLTPLASRQPEIKMLKDAWETAKRGNHSKIFIHAEAGIGKSRLVQEIRETVREDGGTPMTVVCSPLHSDTALYPFIELIHRVIRVRQDDPADFKLTRLQKVLRGLRFPGKDTEDLLAALLSLKNNNFGDAFEKLDPEQRQQRTFGAIIDWMLEVAARTPVLLVLEDLQAADPSTLDLVEQGLDRFDDSAILMLLVARDEFQTTWGERRDIIDMRLRRLDATAIKSIIGGICGGCALPEELLTQIESKCDGVPLYAEEFTKMVLESDLLAKREGKYELVRPLSNLAIPSSLQDSLLARLDRLRDGKSVAQWGAAIGREFSYELIKALLPDEIADNGLKELLDLEVIYKRKRTLQTTFIFKHALIQDAAYTSLLRSERREYHATIARVLLEDSGASVAQSPEIAAHHLELAERYEEAIGYWLAAGKRAGERATNKEGLAHFNKGLRLLDRLPAGRARDSLELRLQMARGPLLIPIEGNGSVAVRETFSRALELTNVLSATKERFPILFGLRSYFLSSGQLQKAHDLSRELSRLADQTGDPGHRLEAYTALANTLFFRGDFIETENQARAAMEIYDPHRFRHHAHIYGTDPGVLCLSRLSNASWQRGRPDRGRIQLAEMLTLAEDVGHQFTLTSALNLAALLRLWRREPELARECAARSFTISEEHGYRFTYAWSRMLHGQALFDLGQEDEGMRELETGFEHTRTLSAKLMEPWFGAILATAKIAKGHMSEANALLSDALDSVAESGTTYALPTLHCLKGEMLLETADIGRGEDDAYDSFLTAANIARSHGSRATELRATVGIVKSRRGQPEEIEARRLLRDVLVYFTPGEDSKDLGEALDLVEEYPAAEITR